MYIHAIPYVRAYGECVSVSMEVSAKLTKNCKI